jgi:hypothetical protein
MSVSRDYPGELNIIHYQPATFKRTFTWTIGETAVNVTNYTATFAIRQPNSTTVVASATSSAGIVMGGSAGTLAVTIADDVMAAVAVGAYSFDLVVVSPGGETTALVAGTFVVTRV